METCLFYTDIALKKLMLLYEVIQNVTDLLSPGLSSELHVTGVNDSRPNVGSTLKDAAFVADLQNFCDSVKKLLHIAETQLNAESSGLRSEDSILTTEIYESLQNVENLHEITFSRKRICTEIDSLLKKMYKFVLLWDGHEVHRIQILANDLNDKLEELRFCKTSSNMITTLQSVCDSLELFVKRLYQRQDELGLSRDIVSARAVLLKRCLENVVQTVKLQMEYGESSCFKRSVAFWANRFSCLSRELQLETEDSGKFLHSLQQLSWAFSEGERALLVEDNIEQLSKDVVVQCMAVAYASTPLLQGRISESCQRLLRLILEDPPGVTDELITLEMLVNMSVLRQVVQAFLNSARPLDDLLRDAAADDATTELHRRADLIYQASRFVTCCCTADPSHIFLHLRCMESIDTELVPAVVAFAANPFDAGSIHHITLLYQEWGRLLDELTKCVFDMSNSREMLKLLKSVILQEVDYITECLSELDLARLKTLTGYGQLVRLFPSTWLPAAKRDELVLGFRSVHSTGKSLLKSPLDPQVQHSFAKRLKALSTCVKKNLNPKVVHHSMSDLVKASKPGLSVREVKLNGTIGALVPNIQRLKVRIAALASEVATEFLGNQSVLQVLVTMCQTFEQLAENLTDIRRIKQLLASTQELVDLIKTVATKADGRSLLDQLEVLFGQLTILVTAVRTEDGNQQTAGCRALFSMVSLVVHVLVMAVSVGILRRKDELRSEVWLRKFQCWDLNVSLAQNGTIA